MSSPFTPLLFHITLVLSLNSITASKKPNAPPKELLHSACAHASYPAVCLRTLSSYNGPSNTPQELAKAAVRISLTRAKRISNYMSQLKTRSEKEQGPLRDCVEQIGDTVEELTKTLSELQHLSGGSGFRWHMSNAETWVSAALTNEDTCLDGFREINGMVRSDVKRKVSNVARVTSNALYLINLLDESSGN